MWRRKTSQNLPKSVWEWGLAVGRRDAELSSNHLSGLPPIHHCRSYWAAGQQLLFTCPPTQPAQPTHNTTRNTNIHTESSIWNTLLSTIPAGPTYETLAHQPSRPDHHHTARIEVYPFRFYFDPLCLSPRSSLSTIVHTSPFLWPGPCAPALSMPDQGPPSPTSPYRPTTPSNSRTLCVVVLRASVKLTWHLPSLARDQVLSPPPNKRPAEGVSWGYWGP